MSTGERKRVSVLFCDIVGSTGLAERSGAEAMRELLDRFVAIAVAEVERLGGTVNAFLGDGFMALVGVPASREDHAERAVLMGLALRDRLREGVPVIAGETPIAVRIGINSGLVVVGAVGGERAVGYTAIGDTTNVAARLQSIAGPGEVIISEATARLLDPRFALDVLGPIEIRGRAEPVDAYRVASAGPGPSTPVATRPAGSFVGRHEQMRVMRDLLNRVRLREGQVATLVGDPGMGKTRLLHEFRHLLAMEEIPYCEGRCRSHGQATPYLPLMDAVRQVAGIDAHDPPERVVAGVSAALRERGVGDEEHTPFLTQLLGVPGPRSSSSELSSGAVRARTFTALRMILQPPSDRLAVLAIEDVQWIDRSSREFLTLLAERIAGAPLLLLTTQRPGRSPPWLGLSYSTQIALGRLGPALAREVVRGAAGREVDEEALEVIVQRADGNPFFLEELARHLDEGGGVVPDTVQGVLGARIDRLSEQARVVLQAASVLGREFPPPLLEAVLPEVELASPLDELARHEFLVERTTPSGSLVVFKHGLTQEVAYDGLLTPRRQALHAAAGAALEGALAGRVDASLDRLSYHFARAGQPDRAVGYLARLAAAAAAGHAHGEAARALQAALGQAGMLPPDQRDATSIDLTLALVESLYFLGRLEECRALLVEQDERVGRGAAPAVAARHRFHLAHILSHLGDTEGADREARRAVEEAERSGAAEEAGKAHYVLAREGAWRGRYHAGIKHGHAAVDLLQRAGARWWLAYARCWEAANRALVGDFPRALEGAAAAQEIGEALGDVRVQAYALGMAGWFEAMRGEGPAAVDLARRGLELAPDPLVRALDTAVLGLGLHESGAHETAIETLGEAIEQMGRFGYRRLVSWYTAWRAEARLAAGDVDGAAADAREALAGSLTHGSPWGAAYAERTLGRAAVRQGRPADGEEQLRLALAGFERIEARLDAAVTYGDLAHAARAAGRGDAAQEGVAVARGMLAALAAPVRSRRLDEPLAGPGRAVA